VLPDFQQFPGRKQSEFSKITFFKEISLLRAFSGNHPVRMDWVKSHIGVVVAAESLMLGVLPSRTPAAFATSPVLEFPRTMPKPAMVVLWTRFPASALLE
jgi:hypothetical protein